MREEERELDGSCIEMKSIKIGRTRGDLNTTIVALLSTYYEYPASVRLQSLLVSCHVARYNIAKGDRTTRTSDVA